MEIENPFHIEIELLRTLNVEIEPESVVICNLVQQVQDLDFISVNGESALHISARRNFLNSARILLEAGASVNIKGAVFNYRTPLHTSSYLQDGIEMVRLLLRHGADVNAKDEYESTPLHEASYRDCFENVQELLNWGAGVNAVSDFDETPLISALWYAVRVWPEEKHTSCNIFLTVQALLRAGADVNYNGKIVGTALHWAAEKNLPHIIRFLLKNKAEVNAKNREGRTPLHRAVESSLQPVETIRELIQGGALVNALDLKERSALYYAFDFFHIEAAQELLRSGAHFKFYFIVNVLKQSSCGYRLKYIPAISKELIRYAFVNSPNSLESLRQELDEDERVVYWLRKFSTPECNLVDFKDACATEAGALSKRSCDCGQSNVWVTFMALQVCGCDRNLAILKFLFSGQHSNFDYCFFYKLSKSFLLEVTLNQLSFKEFKESGKRVMLNWPCMKEMEQYLSFEDVAAFIQSQRFVMGASGLEDVFTFTTGKSPAQSSSEIKPPNHKKLRVS